MSTENAPIYLSNLALTPENEKKVFQSPLTNFRELVNMTENNLQHEFDTGFETRYDENDRLDGMGQFQSENLLTDSVNIMNCPQDEDDSLKEHSGTSFYSNEVKVNRQMSNENMGTVKSEQNVTPVTLDQNQDWPGFFFESETEHWEPSNGENNTQKDPGLKQELLNDITPYLSTPQHLPPLVEPNTSHWSESLHTPQPSRVLSGMHTPVWSSAPSDTPLRGWSGYSAFDDSAIALGMTIPTYDPINNHESTGNSLVIENNTTEQDLKVTATDQIEIISVTPVVCDYSTPKVVHPRVNHSDNLDDSIEFLGESHVDPVTFSENRNKVYLPQTYSRSYSKTYIYGPQYKSTDNPPYVKWTIEGGCTKSSSPKLMITEPNPYYSKASYSSIPYTSAYKSITELAPMSAGVMNGHYKSGAPVTMSMMDCTVVMRPEAQHATKHPNLVALLNEQSPDSGVEISPANSGLVLPESHKSQCTPVSQLNFVPSTGASLTLQQQMASTHRSINHEAKHGFSAIPVCPDLNGSISSDKAVDISVFRHPANYNPGQGQTNKQATCKVKQVSSSKRGRGRRSYNMSRVNTNCGSYTQPVQSCTSGQDSTKSSNLHPIVQALQAKMADANKRALQQSNMNKIVTNNSTSTKSSITKIFPQKSYQIPDISNRPAIQPPLFQVPTRPMKVSCNQGSNVAAISPASTPTPLSVQIKSLKRLFVTLHEFSHEHPMTRNLENCYLHKSSEIETIRHAYLLKLPPVEPMLKAVNKHFDMEHIKLLQWCHCQVKIITKLVDSVLNCSESNVSDKENKIADVRDIHMTDKMHVHLLESNIEDSS